jgi:hypothetical protein
VRAEPALFFQIAAALIPVLLFSGVSRSLKPGSLRSLPPSQLVMVGLLILGPPVLAAVVAEFIAISEAVSAKSVPSAFRTVFVADVLAAGTVCLAVALFLPWLPKRRDEQALAISPRAVWPGIFFVIVVSTIGLWLLSGAVNEAINIRAAEEAACIRKFSIDQEREQIDARDRLERQGAEIERVRGQIRQVRRKRPINEAQLKGLQARNDFLEDQQKSIAKYLLDVIDLGLPTEPQSVRAIVAGLGCACDDPPQAVAHDARPCLLRDDLRDPDRARMLRCRAGAAVRPSRTRACVEREDASRLSRGLNVEREAGLDGGRRRTATYAVQRLQQPTRGSPLSWLPPQSGQALLNATSMLLGASGVEGTRWQSRRLRRLVELLRQSSHDPRLAGKR